METAMVLPSLLLVLSVLLGGVTVAAAQLACADAARVGARALARGETDHRARELALSAAPDTADVRLVREAGTVRVTVRAELRIGPVIGPPVEVVGNAAVPLEPGV
ncbi:TadE family type IV pilus minor pilin [Nocardiopsis sp. EMB25]|uniref:TadE family type IV pilus minor pilin n=1 Tax=Nocardiopsis sp. EMB25 TaxID=2835867 RepID=UPI0022841329|nr:TadE family type IV pilus minor pilin [Nocardiopsis sp. EMB25]